MGAAADMLEPQLKTGRMTCAGESLTPPLRGLTGTEGASLPANLSGPRTARVRPLWKAILRDPPKVKTRASA